MQQTTKHASLALLLTLAAVAVLAEFADPWYYVAYCQRVGVGLLGLLNPLRIIRYVLTPIGGLLRVAIFSPLLYLALAWWLVERARSRAR